MAKKGRNLPPGINQSDVEQPSISGSSDDEMRMQENMKMAFLEALREHDAETREEKRQADEEKSQKTKDAEEVKKDGLSAALEFVKSEITGGIFDPDEPGLTKTQAGLLTTAGTGISGYMDPMKSNLRTALDVGRQGIRAGGYVATGAGLEASTMGAIDPMTKHTLSKWAADVLVEAFEGLTRKVQMTESQTISGLSGTFQDLQKAGLLEKMSPAEKAQIANIYAAQSKRSVEAQFEATKYGGAAAWDIMGEKGTKEEYFRMARQGATEHTKSQIDTMVESQRIKEVEDR